ncbi:MAG: FAD-dependent oxidoreductase [Synechococcaceae cyanobacterium]|nr:FAD-dependent oxidoreductase [Synechococcaceae cyanobacterium]
MAEPTAAAAAPVPRPRVLIIGAGFAGLYTALALAAQPSAPSILLIEPRERFLFLPLLYELLSGELPLWQVAPRYDTLLAGHGIAWLAERVERIDADASRVQTSSGQWLAYDRLVIASGGSVDHFAIPGAERHSLGFRSLDDVTRLQALLEQLRRRPAPLQRLAVVGAGPTGVELACKLADLCHGTTRIELIEQGPEPLPGSPAFNREQALLALRRRDVRLRCRTRVTAVQADGLSLRHRDGAADPLDAAGPAAADGAAAASRDETLPVNGVIWTAGLRFAPPPITPPPLRDRRGRFLCEPDLRLRGQPRIFVAGDLAHPLASATVDSVVDSFSTSGSGAATASSDPMAAASAAWPSTAQVAFQQAPVLASNLRRSLAGEPLQPFRWRNLGEMLSLGRGEACLTAVGLTLAGPAAFQLRRLAYLTRLPGFSQQLRAAAAWAAETLP